MEQEKKESTYGGRWALGARGRGGRSDNLDFKVGSYDDFFRTLWYYLLYQRVRVAYGGEFHFFC
jgi:hypothetical protein